ncbi:MAG: T9SS type A sorting domain-containing protein [Saprospiraceae bacterium]|nr:T9SS type A sorting domain-containing protein [Saprospiraceae bacterium]
MRNAPFFVLLFAASSLFAQWQNVGSNITANPRGIYGLSVPSASVVWGITIHPNYTSPAREFTRSVNGGTSWQTGVIDAANGKDFTSLNIFALDANNAWVTMTDNATQRLGRIYKTDNGGLSWTEQKGSFNNLNNAIQAVHFFNGTTGIAYGSPASGDSASDSLRIWRTTNGGTTWPRIPASQLPIPLAGEGIWIYYGNGSYDTVGDTLWFGTRRGRVWRSIDKGASWKAFSVGADEPIYSVAFTNHRVGLAISDGKGYRTLDGGATWNEIIMPNSFLYYQIESVPNSDGTFMLIYEGSDMFYSDFRQAYTLDDGDTWQMLPPRAIECVKFLSSTSGFGGGKIFSSNTGGIYRWTGDFQTLTAVADAGAYRKYGNIFPNPFSDYTTLEFEVDSPAPISYTIAKASGKVVEKGKIERGLMGKNQVMLRPKVPAGTYFITLRQGKRKQTLKLVKQ